MSDFLINVRSSWDPAGVRAYATEVRNAIRQIEAAASGVRGTATPPAAVQAQVQAAQAQAEAGLISIRQSGVLTPAQMAGLERGVRADFERVAQALNVQLAGAQQMRTAAERANEASASAAAAQQRADQLRQARAEREAASLAGQATTGARGTGPARDDRVARQVETRLVATEATRRAQLVDRGLDPELALSREAARAAVAAHDFAETMARRAQRAAVQTARLTQLDVDEVAAAARARVATAAFRGQVAGTVSGQPADVGTIGQAAAQQGGLRARVASAEAQAVLASQEELAARVQAARDKRAQAEAIRAGLAGETVAARAVRLEAEAQEKAAAAAARKAAAQERAAAATQRAAEQQAAVAAPGTAFQRLQQAISRRAGQEERAVSSFPTAGQAVGSGLVTTARFALSGAALYGAVSTVQQMVKDASELERIFSQVQHQFESVGQGDQFAGFRAAMFDISKETGETAKDVAFIGFQMKGAFQDTTVAVQATSDAIKIARVTGLALNEVVDSLTGAALSFGVSVARVGDEALGVQERFGVLAQESLKVFGDTGVVARQAGLDIHELGALIGGLQQISGKSGSSIAENINRVLPAIHESASAILDLYQRVPQLTGRFATIGELVQRGQSGQVLIELVRDFEKLDKTTQDYVITQLGSRREAQTVIGLLRQHAVIVGYLDAQYNNVGKTQQYFDDLQRTLAQRVARLRAEFVAFGQELFAAGIGDVLKDIASGASAVIQVGGDIVHVFATVNQATGGLAAKLVELYGILRLISALRAINLGEGVLGALVGGTRAQAVAQAGGAALTARAGAVGGFLGGIPARFAAGYAGGAAAGAGTLGGLLGAGGAAAGGVIGGSLEALGLTNPYVLAAAGAVAVNIAYQSQKHKVNEAAKKFADQLNRITDERLDQLIADQGSGLGAIETSVLEHLGLKTPRSEAKQERGQRRYAQVQLEAQALREAGLASSRQQPGAIPDFFGNLPTESVGKIYDRAAQGYESEIKEIEKQIAAARRDPKKRARLEATVKAIQDKASAAADAAAQASIDVADDAAEARNLFEAGLISGGEYIAKLDEAITDLQARIPSLPPDQKAAADRQLSQLQRDLNKTQSDFLQSAAEFNVSQAELAGAAPQAKIDSLLGLLRNPQFTDPKARVQVSNEIVQAQRAILAEQVQAASSAAEAAEILQRGVPVPQEVRVAQTVDAVRAYDVAFNQFLQAALGGVQQASDATVAIVTLAIDGNISIQQAARDFLSKQLGQLVIQLSGAIFGGQGDLSAIFTQIGAITTALQKEVPESIVQPAASTIAGSPGETAAKLNQAANDAESAAKKAHQDQEAAARARIALRKALTEGDPVAQAQASIEEAQFLASIAETEAEQLNAQAQLVTAQHQLALAQVQVGDAYRNIDKAMAQAAGDTVRVAQIELEQARAHVQAARERGDLLGGLEAEAQAVAAQAQLVQAQIDAGQQQTDFLLQMERITTQQAIAQLEALLRIPGITQEQTQSLLLKIQQLRRDVSRDFQFDLPTEFTLPTLYEVRRANQLGAVGAGYQDNRNISISVSAQNMSDLEGIAQTFADAFSGPPRYGSVPRKY